MNTARFKKGGFEDHRKLFQVIFEQAAIGVGLYSTLKGRFLKINKKYCDILGYSEEEMLNKDFQSITYPEDLKSDFEIIDLLNSGKIREFSKEKRYVRKNGDIVWVNVTVSPLWAPGERPDCHITVVQDITERKQAQEEHAHLLEKEFSSRSDAEAARKLDRMKSMFIASTSHELRTPLNSIIGFTGILLQGWTGELNKEQRNYLEMINTSSKHLLELIIDILDVSKIESGNVDIKVSGFDLKGVIDEAISTLQVGIKEKGLDIIVETENIFIRSDRRRLLQCIINIIGNSVKYTEKGSIKICANVIDNKVEMSVTDTGIGIKTEDIPKLFIPFSRLDSPLTLKNSGTGLGLYLTKKLARDVLGGEIFVTSQYGAGSTFIIQIPQDIEESQTTARDIKNKVTI